MTKYLLAGAFSVGTRLSHMELLSTSMRVPKNDVRSKPDRTVHHLLLDKCVTSGQRTQLTQKVGLHNLSQILPLTVWQAMKFATIQAH